MTPERWKEVQDVLQEALEIEDVSRQDAFVRNACGEDADLLREVRSLLGAVADAENFLEPRVDAKTGSRGSRLFKQERPLDRIASSNRLAKAVWEWCTRQKTWPCIVRSPSNS
jgi:hypothetical protein